MKNECRKLSESFKSKVAIKAIKGLKTIHQIASDHQISVTQLIRGPALLSAGNKK